MNAYLTGLSEPTRSIHRRTVTKLFVATVILGLTTSVSTRAALSDGSDPGAPIRQLNTALLAAMKAGQSISFEQRCVMLAPAVEHAFDLDSVLQASVGMRWSALTADERAALANAFRRYTISSYAANFDSYSGQKFQVQPDPRRLSSGGVVLRTQIVRASGSPVEIDYVMRQTSAGWKAVDVLTDGAISRVAVQRSDFTTLLQRGGVLALEHGLEHKVATLSNGSATWPVSPERGGSAAS